MLSIKSPTSDQTAIQARIDACASAGGGVVTLEAGEYLSGTLELKSGVSLHLQAGAKILGTPDYDAYPVLGDTVNEAADIRALIHADDAERIAITGEGTIHGGADRALAYDSDAEPIRPELLFIRGCKHVSIKGVTLTHSAFWTLHLMRCEDVLIEGITIFNRYDRINTDGIDPDGCKRVRITNCSIEAGDDCIVLKSTEGDDCEDVVISNCLLKTHCTALKLGTESFGKIRNVLMTNCVIRDSRMAFGMFMKDGGSFENIHASHLIIEGDSEFPLFIDSTPRFHGESADGYIRNVSFTHSTIKSPGRFFVNGTAAHPVQTLRIQGLQWELSDYMTFGNMGKPIGSVRQKLDPERSFPERQPYQFTLANVDGLQLCDIQLCESRTGGQPDRGLVYQDNVRAAQIADISEAGIQWLEPKVKEEE